MNRLRLGLIFLLGIWPCLSQAQEDPRISTLKSQLLNVSGRSRIDVLNQLVDRLRLSDQEQALSFAEEAQDLSRKSGYVEGMITSSYFLAILERDRNRFRRAEKAAEEGLDYAKRAGTIQDVLKGYKILEMIYRVFNRQEKREEYASLYQRVRDSLDQVALNRQLNEISGQFAQERQQSASFRAERDQLAEAVAASRAAAEQLRMQKEMEIAQLEMETARLESQALQKELALSQAQVEREQNRYERNIAIAATVLILILALGGILGYRTYRQKRLAATEQKRLERIDRLKDQFLANTSHELRTPLNGIIGLAESLFDRSEGAFQKDNLAMIIASGKRLSSLVDDILDFSRLKNHEVRLQLKPVDPFTLADTIIKLHRPLTVKKGLYIENMVDRHLPAMKADENRLQQVMHNLVGNAIKFTERGSILVSARHQGDQVEISVADTGIGIPHDKQSLIFREFEQADGSISREHTGTGLGLSISKKLVELHGGRLWVTSSPGMGSTFSFSIPVSEEAATIKDPVTHALSTLAPSIEPEPTHKNGKLLPANGAIYRILIVDDEPINQQVFHNHLLDPVFHITTAMNGAEAIQLINAGHTFDLVLLDIMMPKMSGYEVCEYIRERYMPSELPVIMVTAKNQVQDLVEGFTSGANDYLAKPFSKDELLARIKTHLNLHRINTATGRFVPHEFIRALGRETITEVQLGDQVEKEVTVFFSDIRSYTSLSEGMTPEENFGFVSAYAKRMGPIINRHGGFVNQYLGDGIMAIFQYSPADAIEAAFEMQREINHYNEYRTAKGRKPIRVGMGLHTGPLIMGIIGDDLRTDAATISDTVNTAARMEGLTKFYGAKILVSEATLAGLQDPTQFSYRYLGKVQVKGKSLAIGVYEFFDTEIDPQQQLKNQTHPYFEQGLRHYYARGFHKALSFFEEVIAQNPKDSAAIHYRAKAQACLQYGVSEEWTGVEMMEGK